MRTPSKKQVSDYLSNVMKTRTKVTYFGPLSEYEKKNSDVKQMGYGAPYLIEYESKGRRGKLILSTMRIGRGFGHDYRSDRIENLVMAYDTWNKLPSHCKVSDLGAFRRRDSAMITLGDADEFFLLRPMIDGVEYAKDLERIASRGELEEYDVQRSRALARYLARIHSLKNNKAECELYARKIRDTVGHGECVFGLADSYPAQADYLKNDEIMELEKKCVEHRWRLKWNATRLARVHGDFHPWNILFSRDTEKNPTKFGLLDRSRGEWGEPADDLCALSINYIFSSLRKYGDLSNEFGTLFREFINTYLAESNDFQVLDAMPLFFAFRCLVIASPVWYPTLSIEVRRKIFNFASNVLDAKQFEPKNVNQYFGGT